MTTSPDLPVELWLHILSNVPRSHLHNLLGVNRLLFELAMNDLYEEVRLISEDKETKKVLEQLQYSDVARRVKRLYVRLDWLSPMDASLDLGRRLSQNMAALTNSNRRERSEDLFYVASSVLKGCSSLQEVTVVIHDQSLSSTFVEFLNSLWKQDSIAPRLIKLSIDSTKLNLPDIIHPIVMAQKTMPNLQSLSLTVTPSRLGAHSELLQRSMNNALRKLFAVYRSRLTSISLSSPQFQDVAGLLESSAQLFCPNLTTFELHTIFTAHPPGYLGLSSFLSDHADTLQHLVIQPRPPFATDIKANDYLYCNWILSKDSDADSTSLRRKIFPRLITLELGLRNPWDPFDHNLHALRHDSKILPSVSILAPTLNNLTLTILPLSFIRISDIVDDLAHSSSRLETLRLRAEILCPQLFDILSSKLLGLRYLDVDYGLAASELRITKSEKIQGPRRFVKAMQERSYSNWMLTTLRMTSAPNGWYCRGRHPSKFAMRALAKCLSSNPTLDDHYSCYCSDALSSDRPV